MEEERTKKMGKEKKMREMKLILGEREKGPLGVGSVLQGSRW